MYRIFDQNTLVIGSSSFIGGYLLNNFNEQAIQTYFNNKIKNGVKFDITKDEIKIILKKFNINKVLLIGGIVNFNEIKKNINYATLVNVTNMKKIIQSIASFGAKIIFFSSESVFDGKKGNYEETSIPNPKFTYGDHKYQIEKFIQEITGNYLIFRISKVFSSNLEEKTLITNWLRQLIRDETIMVAQDNIFSPIYIHDCVKIIKKLIIQNETGIFNVCSDEQLSRWNMFELLMTEYAKIRPFKGQIRLMKLNDIKGAEALPLNTSLNYKKTYEATKINPVKFIDITRTIVMNYFSNNQNYYEVYK